MRIETIGDATLYLGDCLEILPTLGRVDAVVTDPPYSSPVVTSFGRENARDYEGGLNIQRHFLRLLLAGISADRVLMFCDDDYYPIIHQEFYSWPFRQLVIWDKGQIGLGRGFRRRHELLFYASQIGGDLETWNGVSSHASVLSFSPVPSTEKQHGAQKPLPLVKYLVQATGASTILDPFMGSGTTGVACANLGRKFIGIEIEPKYFDIACRRIADAYKQPRLFDDPKPQPQPMELPL